MTKNKLATRRDFLRLAGTAALYAGTMPLSGQAAPTESGTSRRPNILLVFPDQLRHDWTGLNPSISVRTPNLVAMAKEGMRFSMALCPAPVCAASRACLALGNEYDRTGVRGNGDNLPDGAVTMYARLRDAGYRVGSVGKLDLHKATHDWGIDGLHRVNGREYYREWGFTDGFDSEGKGDVFHGIKRKEDGTPFGTSPYSKLLEDRHDGSLAEYIRWWDASKDSKQKIGEYSYTAPMSLANDAYNDNWVGQNGLNLLNGFSKDQPWFMQVNFPGPHCPQDITPDMSDWYKDTVFPQPFANDQLPPETHGAIRRNYSAMVDNIDRWLGRYMEALAKRGELDNTIIAFSSDHGEMLGDHNRWAKTLPYHSSASVPLVVCGPGVRKSATYDGPTETMDLTATFLDYAHVVIPADMDSKSLRPLLEGRMATHREYAVSGLRGWRLVCDGRYKLVRGYDPNEVDPKALDKGKRAPKAKTREDVILLFDLKSDPAESKDISSEKPEVVERLKPLLPQVLYASASASQ